MVSTIDQRSGRNVLLTFALQPWWIQWIITSVLALLLFAPILGNSFVNDDFIVLRKVYLGGKLNTDGFFRPLSDITLMLNGWLGGLHPAGYYVLNVLLHATNTVLLFRFLRQWRWTGDNDRQLLFAAIAALLFLTYPFHSEPVVWILGRASLLASTFGILALVIMVSAWKEPLKISGVAICYFIGMAGYETVMVLPGIVFIWLLSGSGGFRRIIKWMTVMSLTLIVHILIRVKVSGTLVGDYGSGFFEKEPAGIAARIAKTIGRFFLPPMNSTRIMTVLFVFIGSILVIILIQLWRKIKNDAGSRYFFLQQTGLLLTASLLPLALGLSTHTSEGDRFLYFSSFFFCSLLSFSLIIFFFQKPALNVFLTGLVAFNIFFLEQTNMNWRRASDSVTTLVGLVRGHQGVGKLFIVNLPDQYDGGFIFRTGFPEAMQVLDLDTTNIVVVNKIIRDQILSLPSVISPEISGEDIFIPPHAHLRRYGRDEMIIEPGKETIPVGKNDRIVYWNKREWIQL